MKGCGPGSQTSVLDPTGACAKSAQAGVTCDLPTRKEWKGVVARPPERTESAPKVLEAGEGSPVPWQTSKLSAQGAYVTVGRR